MDDARPGTGDPSGKAGVVAFDEGSYRPPFIWFGGKSAVADVVWRAMGADVGNYVEPFFGSGAAMMLRPGGSNGGIETINDADGFVANFWRAVKHDPDAVAEHADNPVNECDLHARHIWLVGQRESLTERLMGDPCFYDAKIAGWWVWGVNCWIGGGWCSGRGPWTSVDGVFQKSGNAGHGVNRKPPHISNAGQGVNRTLPHLGDAGQGECAERRNFLVGYIRRLADRLRAVRVCCGDWARVCTKAPTFNHGDTGVFLDPPYSFEAGRDMGCYAVDSGTVAHAVREWAVENGSNPLMRIVLCGYEGEHAMPDDWRVVEWKARGGYANMADGESIGKANAHRERLWLSPHCLTPESDTGGLFDE